jgi:hypothetical protein
VPDIVGSFLHVEDCVQGLMFDDVMNKSGMRTSDEKTGNDWQGEVILRITLVAPPGHFLFSIPRSCLRFPRSMMGVCPGE